MKISREIKRIRKTNKISRKKLAYILDIKISDVFKLENDLIILDEKTKNILVNRFNINLDKSLLIDNKMIIKKNKTIFIYKLIVLGIIFSYNNSNEITSYTLDGISYTSLYTNGLLRTYRSNNLYYDYNSLIEIDGPNDYIVYSYNARGIRKSKTVNGITTNYILNGNKIIRETTGNNVINYYYDSNYDVIGLTYNNQKYLYLKNLQNDVIGIIDSSGILIVKYYYDAYGNIISITDTSGINLGNINSFRYRSYYYDNETGWYYLNSRYYDPFIKRFITPDDVGYLGTSESVGSYNLYSYCENNPVNMADYSGNDAIYVVVKDLFHIGLPIVGHAQLYYQDKNNNWYRTEFCGKKKRNAVITNCKVGYEEIIELFKSNTYYCTYMSGDFSCIYEYIKDYIGTNYGGYDLFTNNCLHYAHNALIYALTRGTDSFGPNTIIPSRYDPYLYYSIYQKYVCPIPCVKNRRLMVSRDYYLENSFLYFERNYNR